MEYMIYDSGVLPRPEEFHADTYTLLQSFDGTYRLRLFFETEERWYDIQPSGNTIRVDLRLKHVCTLIDGRVFVMYHDEVGLVRFGICWLEEIPSEE